MTNLLPYSGTTHATRATRARTSRSSSSSPSPGSSRSAPVPSTPSDLLSSLTKHKDDWVGCEWISLYSIPTPVIDNAQRLRMPLSPKPGLNPTLVCCISFGLTSIVTHPKIISLLEAQESIFLSDPSKRDINRMVSDWYRTFPLAVPDLSMAGTKRYNVPFTAQVKAELSQLAGDLGLNVSSLAALAAIIPLASQPTTFDDDRRDFRTIVRKFFWLVGIRKRVGDGMVPSLASEGLSNCTVDSPWDDADDDLWASE